IGTWGYAWRGTTSSGCSGRGRPFSTTGGRRTSMPPSTWLAPTCAGLTWTMCCSPERIWRGRTCPGRRCGRPGSAARPSPAPGPAPDARDSLAAMERGWRRAAGDGDTEAMIKLGLLAEEQGDLAGAERWYRMAADAGDGTAMGALATLYFEHGDAARAEEWYR